MPPDCSGYPKKLHIRLWMEEEEGDQRVVQPAGSGAGAPSGAAYGEGGASQGGDTANRDGSDDEGDEGGDEGASRKAGGKPQHWARQFFAPAFAHIPNDPRTRCAKCQQGPFGTSQTQTDHRTLLSHLRHCTKVAGLHDKACVLYFSNVCSLFFSRAPTAASLPFAGPCMPWLPAPSPHPLRTFIASLQHDSTTRVKAATELENRNNVQTGRRLKTNKLKSSGRAGAMGPPPLRAATTNASSNGAGASCTLCSPGFSFYHDVCASV